MEDVNGAGSRGLVSSLREQLLEKMNASQKGTTNSGVDLNSEDTIKDDAVVREPIPPPVPPHKPKPIGSQVKPPIAPKPPHISREVKLYETEPTGDMYKPSIFVSASEDESNIIKPYINLLSSTSNASTSSVSERHENGGLSTLRASREAPRPSALCFNGDPSIHDKIVDELKRQGIIRSSDRLMKKRNEASNHDRRPVTQSQQQDRNSFPDTSPPKKHSTADDTSLSASNDKLGSAVSDRSSTTTTASAETEVVPDYCTGNEEEDKRLKKLHHAAKEFYTVQESFLKYLRDMGEVYPEYVTEFGKRLGKDLLIRQGSQLHIVRELQILFEQLIGFHRLLLEEFSSRLDGWSSLNPNMADVILKYADFLKICKPFLLEKSRFVQELTRLREENKDFDNATVAFEQKILKRGVGGVVQQLDQVHQNFMRYKILMMSYNRYLEPGSEEQLKTLDAIAKLEKIAQSVNDSMGLPSNEQLFKLYDRFQCHFDVFYPGRRLIRQGEVFKQTRKEPQPRYLVLFSDTLWVCRVMSGFGSSGLFDMGRSYRIPIETVRTESNPHEDYEQQLYIKSKYKSLILIMSNADERRKWQKDIDTAREEKRQYKRRMSEAIERQRRQSVNPLIMESPLQEESIASDQNALEDSCSVILPATTLSSTEAFTPNGVTAATSRRNSDSQESSSHPSTPVDDQAGSASMQGSLARKRRVLRADAVKPLWIPDDSSSKCLMEGCDTRIVIVEPQTLFLAPINKGLKRMNIEKRMIPDNGLVFGKVMLRNAKGGEIVRHAQLSDGMVLKFFKAAFDDEPCEQYVIYGFELRETKVDSGGTLFELTHRNQIQTDRKEHVISFRVENEKSVNKWSTALRQGLGIEGSP
ncbi:PH domain protein [Ancylostoma ceylanicum]|uniref:PH domain protein n=1 Tax=Ancylostoma ceylanicum TaxID=53326 RepID=A0A0D6M969_9BILA|nr:PH domain protein [Ancylostoma ceylanicum]